jgi:hypothetical protein
MVAGKNPSDAILRECKAKYMEFILNQLSIIKKYFPPSRVTCIGPVSTHSMDIALRLNPKEILVVEPDPNRAEELMRLYKHQDSLEFYADAVLDQGEPRVYYRASTSAASGFISPDELKDIWPNVEESEQIHLEPESNEWADISRRYANWVFIDRLDLSISTGKLSPLIRAADVAVLRNQASRDETTEHLKRAEQDADTWLSGLDMLELLSFPDPRYSLNREVWVKDWKAKCERMTLQLDTLEKTAAHVDTLNQELDTVRASGQIELAELQAAFDELVRTSQLKTKEQEATLAKQDLADIRAQLRQALKDNESLQDKLSEVSELLKLAAAEYKKEKS